MNFRASRFKGITTLLSGLALALVVSACTLGEDHVDGYVGQPGSGRTTEGGPSDHLIVVSPSTATLLAPEGGLVHSILKLSKSPVENETLEWRITDGSGVFEDYEGNVTITPTTEEFQLPIKPLDDGLYQGERRFFLDIWGDPEIFYALVRVEIRVVDSTAAPVASFAAPAQTVTEGDPVTQIDVLLSTPAAHTTVVQFTKTGLAVEGTDYALSPADTVIFHPGETQKSIDLFVLDDSEAEPMEDVTLTLTSVIEGAATIDGANNRHIAWILDNDGTSLFNITGVTGGTDVTQDGYLTNGNTATIHWTSAAGAIAYEVVLFREDGTSVACAPPAPGVYTSYTFAGCPLTEGQTYRVSVVATIGGDTYPAGNNMFPVQVVTQAPSDFSIIGVTGGLDISPNSVLSGGVYPTVHWTDSPNEYEYLIRIYRSNGSTIQCPEVRVPANVTAYAFDNCALTPGQNYRVYVSAKNVAGLSNLAANNLFVFTVTNQPTGYMITGVTGGVSDNLVDDKMTDGQNPTVHWQEALGAINYDVTIYDDSENVVVCLTQNVAATSATLSTCDFNLHEVYKIEVIAYNSDGDAFLAANAKFPFRYMVGLYISGSGESYYRGVPITTCGGANGDQCTAANPYAADDVITESQVRVANNGVLAAGAWSGGPAVPGNGILEMEVNRLWVEAGSAISMNGRGYTAGVGPGAGQDFSGDDRGGTGGAYGGFGGYNNGQSSSPYGSITNPSHLGSGGGSNPYTCCTGFGPAVGGSGGGIVRVKVAGTLVLNGTISSNGDPGVSLRRGNSTTGYTILASGGGSGGSVILEVQNLVGATGAVTVNGGIGGSDGAAQGGSGSGGRALIIIDDDSGYTGGMAALTTEAFGGTVGSSTSGAAGTIVFKSPSHIVGHLVVDNGPNPYREGVETPAPVGLNLDSWETRNFGTLLVGALDNLLLFSEVIDYRIAVQGQLTLPAGGTDLTIASGGRLDWRRKTKISYQNLTIEAGGVLTHSYNGADIEYLIDIDVVNLYLAGEIDVSGRGYAAGQGPGYSGVTAGGAYGGMAGRGSSHLSAQPYGSIKAPNHLGSGGGRGSGGGLVLIAATGEVNLTGAIRANGSDATNSGGGGSGGTIHISAGAITGSGAVLQSLGGSGSGTGGGGGSGGRIAILASDDQYGILGINAQAYGGTSSYRDGAAGTIYLFRGGDDNHGHLLVNNSTRTYREDVTTPLLAVEDFDSIGSDLSGTVHIPFGQTFNLPSDVIDYRLVVEGSFTVPSVTELTIANQGRLEMRRDLALIYQKLTIDAGGLLTHSTNQDRKSYVIDVVVDDLVLNGSIDVTDKGYMGGVGPGAGFTLNENILPGAGYGGWGGLVPESAGGNPYGDFKNPNDLGSGGGVHIDGNGNITRVGGHGGGLVKLQVANKLTLNGSVVANGGDGRSSLSLRGGGGSGGAIYIHTHEIEGDGAILSAVGGNGDSGAGNGSGGRIALIYDIDNYQGGAINMDFRSFGGTSTSRPASAGSIFVFDEDTENYGHLIVDNNNLPHVQGSETPAPVGADLDSYITRNNGVLLVSPGENFLLHSNTIDYNLVVQGAITLPGGSQDLIIGTGGNLEWRRGSTMTLNSLTIQSGGLLTHSANSGGPSYVLDLQLGTFTLDGTIDVTGKGYGPGMGPGAGTSDSGAAYGGQGGVGSDGVITSTYGDPKDPVNLGSSASNRRGGGLIKIEVAGLATINGSLVANGQSTVSCSGGGSGGTISLKALEIAGTGGVLSASGSPSCGNGGGGGGGRIAVTYTTDSYSPGGISDLSLRAWGGAGGAAGAAGTIYLMQQGVDNLGRLIVDNNGVASGEWSTTRFPHNVAFDDVDVGAGVRMEIPQGSTFALNSSTLDYHLVLGGNFTFPGPGTNFTVASGGTLEVRKNLPIVLDSLTVQAGGKLTHSSNSTLRSYVVDFEVGDLTLHGDVDVSGKGYQGGSGPGAPSGNYSGGSHGGYGGLGASDSNPQGLPYGQIRQPYDLGSGGANTSGGRGGGIVHFEVNGTATLSGKILANGFAGSGTHTAGGAGGSIHIVTNQLAGNGAVLQARGGNGQGNGGSGSGGRIALSYEADNYTGTVGALSIEAPGGTTGNDRAGAAGTIYLVDSSNPANNGTLIVDNGPNLYRRNVNTYITDSFVYDTYSVSSNAGLYVPSHVTLPLWTNTLNFALKVAGTVLWPLNLTLAATGYIDWQSNAPLVLDNLTMVSGSRIQHARNSTAKLYFLNLQIAQDFIMQPNTVMDVSASGFQGGYGPGKGANAVAPAASASGASHGGLGGEGLGLTPPGAMYGVASNPTGLGSGGGARYGGNPTALQALGTAGGGLVQITVGGTFDFNGEIYANGENATSNVGGGSGGSININVGTLAGQNGVLEAKGGSTPNSTSSGGTGGGGRVFIGYSVDNYIGPLIPNVDAGDGHADRLGQPGSVQVN